MNRISAHSAWPKPQIEDFLSTYVAPIRIAAQSGSGFPQICSLWFRYEDERILCATKSSSRIVRLLEKEARCAFELAPNEPPYFGVRGRGIAKIESAGADTLLSSLIDRYLGSRDSDLARWLLSQVENEVSISIEIDWISSWDYSERMEK
ncbi:MAG: pyridoxamine 5'-phosphate oxidase [Deltaproteobacteria bacterium]|nr:pyridoxamine 5'-phosphate oxidase [Deltaproteobacteria bacterium]